MMDLDVVSQNKALKTLARKSFVIQLFIGDSQIENLERMNYLSRKTYRSFNWEEHFNNLRTRIPMQLVV